ncbi:FAD-dependent monooxygenase [Rhodococcus ruber]
MTSESPAPPDPTAASRSHVVVVGAGPVGLVAALAAHSHGLRATVLEAEGSDRLRAGSRATYLYRETLDQLDTFSPGLGARLAREGVTWPRIRSTYHGRTVYERTFPRAPHGAFGSSISQRLQERAMLEHVEAAGIPIRWNTRVGSVSSTADGVAVHLVDGSTIDTDYVVAADGAHSAVRTSLGIEMEGPRSDASFVIVDVDEVADGPLPLVREFHYRHPAVEGRNVLVLPFRGGWRLDLQARRDDDVEALQSADGTAAWVAAVLGERYRDRIAWVSRYRFHRAVAARFTDPHNRVFLAGEAAHLFAPFGGGRGLNSGVRDAQAAIEAFAAAARDGGDAAAREQVGAAGETRRRAGHFNADAAGGALAQMEANTVLDRAAQWGAAFAARWWSRPGMWLDSRVTSGSAERFSPSTRF